MRPRDPERNFKPEWPRGCWPSPDQRLLLQACLLEDESLAQASFRKWSEGTDLFFLEDGLGTLLMLLPDRLARWRIDSYDDRRLRGIVRYYWVRHQMFRRDLRIVARQLQEAGVDILLLKGAALNLRIYPKSTRLMSDLDIAVPRYQIEKAVSALVAGGWNSMFRSVESLPSVTHGCHFKRGDTELDLHWDFFHGRPLTAEQQSRIWSESETAEIDGIPVRILSPECQILHTCEHGLRYNETPPLRWIADTFFILKNAGEVDWQRLQILANEFGLVEPVVRTLEYLHHWLGVALPAGAVDMMAKPRVSPIERLEFAIVTRRMPGAHPFWKELPGRILDFRRARRQQPQLTLSTYLALANNLDGSLWSNLRNLSRLQLSAIAGDLASLARQAASILKRSCQTYVVSIFADEGWHGWFPPERTDFGNLRWSTTRASIRLPAVPDIKKIVLEIAPIRPWHGDLDECLSFRFDRHAIDRRNVHFDDWMVTITIESPIEMFPAGSLRRLEIRCDPLKAPGSDPRELGIPVKQVSLLSDSRMEAAADTGLSE